MTPGVIVPGGVDTEPTEDVRELLHEAATAGYRCLDRVDSEPVGAVEAAIRILEDSRMPNAGFGAVLDEAGVVRLDVGLVDGATQRFAGLTGLTGVANPISFAGHLLRATQGPVLLAGDGAVRFAQAQGYGPADLRTSEQLAIWQAARLRGMDGTRSPFTGRPVSISETVGCVAVTADGRLAAGSSTGGIFLKRVGRVGDAAVSGAGIYADDRIAALCSGQGEVAIELSLALRAALHCRDLGDAQRAAGWAVGYGVQRRDMVGGVIVYDAACDEIGVASSTASFAALTCDATGTQLVCSRFVERAQP